jgi:hypothetical protein
MTIKNNSVTPAPVDNKKDHLLSKALHVVHFYFNKFLILESKEEYYF